MPDYMCEKCKYSTTDKKIFSFHLKSKKHLRDTTVQAKYMCVECCYSTDISSGYTSHCKTKGHIRRCANTDHLCACGKSFHSANSLMWHKKTCDTPDPPDTPVATTDSPASPDSSTTDPNTAKFSMTDMKDIMRTVMQESNNTNNINVDNRVENNHHNNITVKVFLDKHCSNATPIQNFMDNIEFTEEEFVRSIEDSCKEVSLAKVFNREIDKFDIVNRPIHCTDEKRLILHVKDTHVWRESNEPLAIKTEQYIRIIHTMMRTKWRNASRLWSDENIRKRGTLTHGALYNEYMYITTKKNMWTGPVDEVTLGKFGRKIIKNMRMNSEIKNQIIDTIIANDELNQSTETDRCD